jgi:uncharacterized membrane protein
MDEAGTAPHSMRQAMRIIRFAAMVAAFVFETAAIVSFVVQFKRIDHTTGFLAGGAVVISVLLIATKGRGNSADRK